jgi:hypothetical protein
VYAVDGAVERVRVLAFYMRANNGGKVSNLTVGPTQSIPLTLHDTIGCPLLYRVRAAIRGYLTPIFTMNDILIKNNFLNQKEFLELQNTMGRPADFPWFYMDSEVSKGEERKDCYFSHMFYHQHEPSERIPIVAPILTQLHPCSLWRIKANLKTRTTSVTPLSNEFHVDMEFLPEHKLNFWTTAIFHVNTNNGYTEFEDGTRVESVANRMVTFPTTMKYRSTSCSDSKTRITINFNYFEIDYKPNDEKENNSTKL